MAITDSDSHKRQLSQAILGSVIGSLLPTACACVCVACITVCERVYVNVRVCVCMRVSTCVCLCICMYVHVYLSMYTRFIRLSPSMESHSARMHMYQRLLERPVLWAARSISPALQADSLAQTVR